MVDPADGSGNNVIDPINDGEGETIYYNRENGTCWVYTDLDNLNDGGGLLGNNIN